MRAMDYGRAAVMAGGLLISAAPAMAQTVAPGTETVPPALQQLPPDIDPHSLSRLPLVQRDQMDAAGQKAYDAVVDPKSRLHADMVGPAGIWLHVPALSPDVREINWYLRHQVKFPPQITELIILASAREMNGETEWAAHEPAALKAGLPQRVVDIIKYRKKLDGLTPEETVIIKIARELLGQKHLSAATYAEGQKTLGQQNLINLIMLMANYAQTSIILHAFDQQLPLGSPQLLPVAQN